MQQACVDTHAGAFELRAGRQEIYLDSAKQLGIREGPNQRCSFDALRVQYRPPSHPGVDLFVGREVQPKEDAFEDSASNGAKVWGIYGAKLLTLGSDYLDSFYIGIDRNNSSFNQGVGDEERHTLGLRWVGEHGAWRYSYEGFYQGGRFNGADIQAWALVTENYYRLSVDSWQPTFGVRANIASGDSDLNDNKLGTFDALFLDLNYLAEAGVLYTPRNLYELQTMIDLFPSKDLRVRLRSNFLWRQNTSDAVYVSPGVPLVAGDTSDKRFIGYVLDVAATWEVNHNLKLAASYAFAAAGDVIEDAGGRDTQYFISSLTFRF